jgi:TonB family protein
LNGGCTFKSATCYDRVQMILATNVKNSRLPSALLALSLSLLLNSSCVYYNTFYYAEKYFKQAEENQEKREKQAQGQKQQPQSYPPTGKQYPGKGFEEGYQKGYQPPQRGSYNPDKELYEKAINKASKVLTFHPKSKYVDDALYIIGKSYYSMEEYQKADRKFKELVVNSPKSKFIPKAYFYMGMSHFHLEDYAKAQEAYGEVLKIPKKKELKDQASFMLAEIAYKEQDYPKAIELYQQMLSQYRKSEKSAQAQLQIGECHFQLEDYQAAAAAFEMVEKHRPDTETYYLAKFRRGESLYLSGKQEPGLAVFRKLGEDERYFHHQAAVKLKIAAGEHQLGRRDRAMKTYEEVIESHPRSEESARAYYELGRIHQLELLDLTKAKEMFDKCKTEKPSSDIANEALARSAEIAKLKSYREQLADSLGEAGAETQFLLAEALLLDMGQPDSALQEYMDLVEREPESDYAPKALYAAAYIYREFKGDTTEALDLYERITREYPTSEYALVAADSLRLDLDVADSLNVGGLFEHAQNLLFNRGDPDSALLLLFEVEARFPQSDYAPQAAFTRAWIVDTYLFPEDSSGIYAYQEIIEKYPDTEFAQAARNRLGLTRKTSDLAAQYTLVEGGDTTTFNPEDTTTYSKLGYPMAPEPLRAGLFVYPEELIDYEYRGKVLLKIFIDTFGQVREAEVLGSSDSELIDQAAIDAALKTTFDFHRMDPKELNGYFLHQVKFEPPERNGSRYEPGVGP